MYGEGYGHGYGYGQDIVKSEFGEEVIVKVMVKVAGAVTMGLWLVQTYAQMSDRECSEEYTVLPLI